MAPSSVSSAVMSPHSVKKAELGSLRGPSCRKNQQLRTTTESKVESNSSKTHEEKPVPERKATKDDPELASVLISDLNAIRILVTCSICDQLLYEPWTLSCGHTYCYSCLCNWFIPNKAKKTCPECRTTIEQIPAPAFLVKQMVDIFCKRTETMPSDETIDQHNVKRAEEMADVEKDKNSAQGLFKGTFHGWPTAEILFDEADGVFRCPHCHHEHNGGSQCELCGTRFEGHQGEDGFSDDTLDDFSDVDELELDGDGLHGEIDAEFLDAYQHTFFDQIPRPSRIRFPHIPYSRFSDVSFHHFNHHHHGESLDDYSDENSTSESEPNEYEDEEEDEGSLQDFVVQDDDPVPNRAQAPSARRSRQITAIVDDDSDEGGPVAPPRRRLRQFTSRRNSNQRAGSASAPIEVDSEPAVLRNAGYSPLGAENDADEGESDSIGHLHSVSTGMTSDEERLSPARLYRHESTEHDEMNDENDANTMRISVSDDDDESSSECTPRNAFGDEWLYHGDHREYGYEEYPDPLDDDGDTEMTSSPRASELDCSSSYDSDTDNEE